MTELSDKDLAIALHALGADDAEAREALRVKAETDPSLYHRIAAWEIDLAELALSAETAEPPDDLFSKIEARLDADEPAMTSTVRREGGRWLNTAPGVWRKVLNHDPTSGRKTLLLRCEPGAVIPAHEHGADEELMMLDGEVRLGDLILRAGDFHLARQGSQHVPAISDAGCLILVRC